MDSQGWTIEMELGELRAANQTLIKSLEAANERAYVAENLLKEYVSRYQGRNRSSSPVRYQDRDRSSSPFRGRTRYRSRSPLQPIPRQSAGYERFEELSHSGDDEEDDGYTESILSYIPISPNNLGNGFESDTHQLRSAHSRSYSPQPVSHHSVSAASNNEEDLIYPEESASNYSGSPTPEPYINYRPVDNIEDDLMAPYNERHDGWASAPYDEAAYPLSHSDYDMKNERQLAQDDVKQVPDSAATSNYGDDEYDEEDDGEETSEGTLGHEQEPPAAMPYYHDEKGHAYREEIGGDDVGQEEDLLCCPQWGVANDYRSIRSP